MKDMTIGLRISQERKKLGLSQEMLGEKMGVSRQAISKWESDSTVPEIDKLIAMSKLFDTSVGWLLGVEENPAPVENQTDTLSEKQLQMIEEIVKKYQPKPVAERLRLMLMTCIAALGLVAITVMTLASMGIFDREPENTATLETLRSDVNSQLAELDSRIGSLNAVMTQTPEPALLAEYNIEILSTASGSAVQIGFSAVPNTWQKGDSGTLSIRRAGMETVQMECIWDGAFLTTDTILLDVADGYEFCFTLCHSDGTQEQQVVTNAEVENLEQTLSVTAEVTPGTAEYVNQNLVLSNYVMKVSMPSDAFYGSMLWKTVDLVLTSGGEELGRFNLLLAEKEVNEDVLRSPTVAMEYLMITFENIYLPKNEGIQLWICAETNNGLSTTQLADAWVRDADDTLRNQ